jgi:hypothetical protein
MKGKLTIYYDREGDFLELNIGKYREGDFHNLGKGIFERVDKKTKKITGIAIMGFRKRTEGKNDVEISLPVGVEITA